MPTFTPVARRRPRPIPRAVPVPAPILFMVLAVALAGGAPASLPAVARAQAVDGSPADLQFTVRDATTGQPATAERLVIDYVAGRLNTVLDTQPPAASFTTPGVPVKDIGKYVLTLWYQGVPYWWQKRGDELLAGPVQLDVFSATGSLADVALSGVNIVVRQRGATAELEILATVTNDARPQATVLRDGGTFDLPLPPGATAVEATYSRGPEPTPVPITVAGARARLAMPLTPGANSVRLVAVVPWDGTLELDVGSDLPVAAWSLLVAPASVTVDGDGLQAPDEGSAPGYVRRPGPPLGAGESLVVRLHARVPAGEPTDLFTGGPAGGDTATAASPAGAPDGDGGRGLPLPLAALLVLIIIGALVLVRRGRS